MAPRTTVWHLKPHTRAKHEILKRYLQAWTPILSRRFPRVLYIDGFAGPGRYLQGEDGSPIIALKAALEQKAPTSADLHFHFVEKDSDRARSLSAIVRELRIPPNFHVTVHEGEAFEDAFQEILESFHGRLPPTFAFIDPFGWTGAPFWIAREILGFPHCEVLITFMYDEINRFLSHEQQPGNFDAFFGTPKWREGLTRTTERRRNDFLRALYDSQLRNEASAEYVRSFEMRNYSGLVDYYLFYATSNILGLRKMKESMWKIDETGEFRFLDTTNADQLTLFQTEPDLAQLQDQILKRFAGSEITFGEVEDFVLGETAFRETHCKKVLKSLERSIPPALMVVVSSPTRRRGTFADRALRLRFL